MFESYKKGRAFKCPVKFRGQLCVYACGMWVGGWGGVSNTRKEFLLLFKIKNIKDQAVWNSNYYEACSHFWIWYEFQALQLLHFE